ncbi:MAG: DUF255 domain-containing protein [Saprospiraceae bacterium]|nr:DUF255 domain-containing protein [Saprospiraceae bacterium]
MTKRLLLIIAMLGMLIGQNAAQRTTLMPTSTRSNAAATPDHSSKTSERSSTSSERSNSSSKTRPSKTERNQPATYSNTNTRPSQVPSRPKAANTQTTELTVKSGTTNNVKKVAPLKKKENAVVNWMTLDQAIEKSKTEKRKIFIDVYTDWCGWCKHMDSTSFSQPAVANYLNEKFYAVKFNAEQTGDLNFQGKTWKYIKNGSRGYHELASHWLNNRLSFPTSVFLDENMNTIQPLAGYLDAAKLEAILHYFGTDSHRTTPWESYEKKYTSGQMK